MSNEMSTQTKGVTKYPTHKRNPYVSSLVVPSRNKTIAISNQQLGLFDAKTGEEMSESVSFMGLRKRVDTGEFVKIYKNQMKTLFDLSKRAYTIFGYFIDATRINKDTVFFNYEDCMKYSGYKSKNTLNLGITELLEKEFIARTSNHYMYYINPAKFFNGDRLVLFQEVIKKGSQADKRLEENDPLANLNQRNLALEAPDE